ncbi:MAG TPA: NAD(P)-dependent oxidoreductase [Streptosporangiaceae bacterium]|nr:NAD(P)-dependent oxidoreductase [Streptosporangiaceae bacterium]
MRFPGVLFADRTFPAAEDFLREAAPQARIEVTDLSSAGQLAAEVVVPLMTRIDGAVMDRVTGLRLIHQWGAGLEGVDVAAATERGIAVGNVPSTASGNADSVAEWCVMAALALSRRLPGLQQSIRETAVWGGPLGQAMLGRTAGIIGLGGIGQALAARLAPFGMRLMAVTRRPDAARAVAVDWLRGMDGLPELLEHSDYVFVCLPLTEDTAGVVDAGALARMRPTAFLCNVGRGGLVDEPALLAALAGNQLAGAALDVFAREPVPAASPLLAEPRVLATPHIAGVTDVSYAATARYLAEVIRRLAARQPLGHCVNWAALGEFYGR